MAQPGPLPNTLTTVAWFDARREFGGGIHVSITIGVDGLPVISYRRQTSVGETTVGDLHVIHCGDVACSANNTITQLDKQAGFFSSIAIGGDGLPVIAYLDGASVALGLKVAKCGNLECSSGNTVAVVHGRRSTAPSITVGLDGLPVISYGAVLGTSTPILHLAFCGDPACNASSNLGIVPIGSVAATSIALGADGAPVVAAYDQTRGELKVAKCANTDCSLTGDGSLSVSVGTVDGANNDAGNYTSITLGDNGLPLISYRALPNALKLVRCGNPACSAGNVISTLDSIGGSGFTAIAIGVDGLPMISYVRNQVFLGVVKCGNTRCSAFAAAHTIFSVDETTDVFEEATSIAIGSDGLPVVAYASHTGSTESVRVAHCGSDRCLPHWTRR